LTLLRATTAFFFLLSLAVNASADASPVDPAASVGPTALPWSEVLTRYLAASQEQQARLRDTSMEVEIDARIPRLKKEGSLHALRLITRLGQITYQAVRLAGDKMVNKDVIARYLTAETEASKGILDSRGRPQSIAITPENYKFRQKAVMTADGRQTYILQVTPRKKRLGLFKGEIWIDADTGMPVRESGRLVKNPSVFLRKVDFVREYEIVDGVALPVKVESRVDTRLVGLAELDIHYSNYSFLETAQSHICALGW
jgi:hypothetical protein